ncbi:MAG: hypothetical protein ACRC1K_07425 [Planctomycetia bacterium]
MIHCESCDAVLAYLFQRSSAGRFCSEFAEFPGADAFDQWYLRTENAGVMVYDCEHGILDGFSGDELLLVEHATFFVPPMCPMLPLRAIAGRWKAEAIHLLSFLRGVPMVGLGVRGETYSVKAFGQVRSVFRTGFSDWDAMRAKKPRTVWEVDCDDHLGCMKCVARRRTVYFGRIDDDCFGEPPPAPVRPIEDRRPEPEDVAF